MGRIAPVLLSLLILLAFSLPLSAQETAPDEDAGQAQMSVDEDKGSMMSVPKSAGRACGSGCSCDKCGMGMGKGGMMGMHGDFDMMTRPAMNRSCRTPEFFLMHREDLSLSPFQVDALKKLYMALKKDMITKGAVVKVLELDLGEIVTKADFKLSDAQDKLKDIEKARTELRMTVLKASSDARDLLSPEQIEKLKELDLDLLMAGMGKPMPMARPSGAMKDMMMDKMRQKMMQ